MFQGKHKALVAYGTRPEAIKLAPVVTEMKASAWLHPVVAVSGQHRRALEHVHQLFRITPEADLGIKPGQPPTQVANRSLEGYSNLLAAGEFDVVVVQGDTAIAFAAALAGFYARVPVVHVEAGLRTGYFYSPFPQEVHRRLITQMASLHLAPTTMSMENLLEEGVYPGDVSVTGNTVVDALQWAAGMRKSTGDAEVERAIAAERPILLVTADQRESRGNEIAAIGRAVSAVAKLRPDLLVVVLADEDARVRDQWAPHLSGSANVHVMKALPYGAFAHLLSRSTAVLTDSGGIQEEAPTFGVPVFVTRDATERPEALEAGTARLVGTQVGAIVNAVTRVLDGPVRAATRRSPNPFGDGNAAPRACAAIEELLGVGRRLPEFGPAAVASEATARAS